MHCFGISFSFTKETHLYEERLTGMFCSLLPSSPGRDEESIPAHLGPPPTPGTWRLHLLAPPGIQPGVGSAHLPGGNRTDMRTGLGFEHQHVGECDREREGTAARPRGLSFAPDAPGATVGRGRLRSRSRYTLLSSAQARGPRRPAPRLGRSQEAPRAGFQSDARDREAAGLALRREPRGAGFLKYTLSLKRDQNMSKNTALETS